MARLNIFSAMALAVPLLANLTAAQALSSANSRRDIVTVTDTATEIIQLGALQIIHPPMATSTSALSESAFLQL